MLTKDPISAWGCDTSGNISPLWSGTKENLQMYRVSPC